MSGRRPLALTRDQVAEAVRAACLAELRALKPGNVHVHGAGHGMSVQDFEASAEILAAVVARPQGSMGERVLEAVEETRARVGCNTNLGIILLTVPLAEAAIGDQAGDLRRRLAAILKALDRADTARVFEAIVRAAPAGLGRADRHDVSQPARVPLREAMAEAAERDLIARQYASDYRDVFDLGLPCYQTSLARWNDPDWSVALVYMTFLSSFPDSHVMRKHGQAVAEALRREAIEPTDRLARADDPQDCTQDMLRLDRDLKTRGLNPGTSADLTVATLLAAALESRGRS